MITTVEFTEGEWARLRAAADGADKLSAEAKNTRAWNPDFNFVGLVGEATFARITGLPFYPERRTRKLADGGEDFPGVDVKGVTREPPLLMRLRSDPLKAPFYALVFVDKGRRLGRYAGYASREMLDAAPDREFGYGATRTLEARDLLSGLPPPVDPEIPRRARWARVWKKLYGQVLARPQHEERRDQIFAWAREHGELEICLEGLSQSQPFRAPLSEADREFLRDLVF